MAEPYKIGVDGSRKGVLELLKKYFEDLGLRGDLKQLDGKRLVSHCSPDERCHGDVLIKDLQVQGRLEQPTGPLPESEELDKGVVQMTDFVNEGLPARIADTDVAVEIPSVDRKWRGVGPPREAPFMGRPRPFKTGTACAPRGDGGALQTAPKAFWGSFVCVSRPSREEFQAVRTMRRHS